MEKQFGRQQSATIATTFESQQTDFSGTTSAMLPVRVLALPSLLTPEALTSRTAVVFDVLRATSTMAAAISAGAAEIRVFGSLEDARTASAAFSGDKILAGEQQTLRPPDFDLGNSPADFTTERCDGKTILMATTNGTKALVAAKSAQIILTGAVVNASATAAAIRRAGLPVTMICSGTQGELSFEDLIGCGAVLSRLSEVKLENDTAHLADIVWQAARDDLPAAFVPTYSHDNLKRAGLVADLDFCARVDHFGVACRVYSTEAGLVVRRSPA